MRPKIEVVRDAFPQRVRCDEGECVIKATRNGVLVATELQVEGDCKRLVCDGRGQVRSENDDADTRAGGNPGLEDCTGFESNDVRTPVSWDISSRRAPRLTIAIEDDLDTGEWAYAVAAAST